MGQSEAYVAAAGDANPIHTDAHAARQAGFPRPVVHGIVTFMNLWRLVASEAGASIARGSCTFAAPVLVEEVIQTQLHRLRSASGTAAIGVRVAGSRRVVKQCSFGLARRTQCSEKPTSR